MILAEQTERAIRAQCNLAHPAVVSISAALALKAAAHAAWDVADTHLANLFGLNESKYEWAVREYYYQKRLEQEAQDEAVQHASNHVSNVSPSRTTDVKLRCC